MAAFAERPLTMNVEPKPDSRLTVQPHPVREADFERIKSLESS